LLTTPRVVASQRISCPTNSTSLSRFESTHLSSKLLQSRLCPNGSGGGAVVDDGPRRRPHRAPSPAAEHHAARSALHRHNARAAWLATTPPNSVRLNSVPSRPLPTLSVSTASRHDPSRQRPSQQRPPMTHPDNVAVASPQRPHSDNARRNSVPPRPIPTTPVTVASPAAAESLGGARARRPKAEYAGRASPPHCGGNA